MKRIYLIRHCKAEGQEPEARLTSEGVRQADELVDFLCNVQIDYIVSSPFERAIHTIRPLSEKLTQEIHIDKRLSERVLSEQNIVNWMEELKKTYLDLDYKLPGGESSREAMDRCVSVIHELLLCEHKNVAVVSHGNLLSLMIRYFDNSFGFDDWARLTNPDIYLLEQDSLGMHSIKRLWK